jgi:predicted peptidase
MQRRPESARPRPDRFALAYEKMAADASPINYASFRAGSVLPANGSDTSARRSAWHLTYTIEPGREWIFPNSSL